MNDPDTGMPKAIMDASWMTAWRTGAASGVCASTWLIQLQEQFKPKKLKGR